MQFDSVRCGVCVMSRYTKWVAYNYGATNYRRTTHWHTLNDSNLMGDVTVLAHNYSRDSFVRTDAGISQWKIYWKLKSHLLILTECFNSKQTKNRENIFITASQRSTTPRSHSWIIQFLPRKDLVATMECSIRVSMRRNMNFSLIVRVERCECSWNIEWIQQLACGTPNVCPNVRLRQKLTNTLCEWNHVNGKINFIKRKPTNAALWLRSPHSPH